MNKLCFCSTTYGGYGIVRVGSLIPESYLLFVCPPSCGRHTSINAIQQEYKNRISYLFFDEHELALGMVEDELCNAIDELLPQIQRPKVFLVYICCVLYLAGFDEKSIIDELKKRNPDIVFQICLMNPVSADTKRPPGLTMQEKMYSLLDFSSSQLNTLNFIGNNVPINSNSEIYEVLKNCGVTETFHVSDQPSFEDFRRMGRSKWNLVVRPEAILAAKSLSSRMEFRFVPVSYDIIQIREQYEEIFSMLSARCELEEYEKRAREAINKAKDAVGKKPIAVGASAVCRPFSLARALIIYGFVVTDIFGKDVVPFEREAYEWIRKYAPEIVIHDTKDPAMTNNIGKCGMAEIAVGYDAGYFAGAESVVDLLGDEGMFGYYGVELLMNLLIESVSHPKDLRKMIEAYGLVA
ncbi:MAG: nitrogenase component 1 [Methanocorpusculum sp.]|uniref:nitrogenase component 1 n=1 Tax=Methanocorpusculum sp. TaxID=2058474 RepID=UPI00272024BF|nr:nitrogenase component 1 [Methanocorpusculum sp.]MDO9522379.1 nitrogenase component 1 [Methanocorpusculum sp.]